MKKILYILCWFTLSFVGVYGSECSQTCKISDAPAPVLTEYIANLNRIEQNIFNEVSLAPQNTEILEKPYSIIQSMNSIMSFNDYFWSFDYHIKTPIFQTIPSQIKRDHDLIQIQTKRLEQILNSTVSRWNGGIVLTDICTGLTNCSIGNINAQNALTELIKNNQEILRFYRSLITDSAFLTSKTNYILVAPNFRAEMSDYYNATTIWSCSQCEWEFGETLDKITDIWSMFSWVEGATDIWIDTWNLLWSWTDSPEYQNLEKDLLSDYLKSSGVSIEQADVMLDNLERYNAGWLSASNPLSNSLTEVEATANSFDLAIKEWINAIIWEEWIPYVELTRIKTEVQSSQDISRAIATLYNDELPYAYAQDTNTQSLQARILKMHFSLIRTANLLEKKTPDAEALCNKQWRGVWRCQFDLILR